ncbi:MAG: lipocalin family protein [Chitinophagaceae bacterium]
MKLRSLLPVILIVSMIVPAGCSKDDDNNQQSQALTNISAAKWKFSEATAGGFDASDEVPSCYRDNLLTFFADNKGKIEESTVVCDPSQEGDFTWQFNSTETEITMDAAVIPGGNNKFNVVSLTATTMVLSQTTNIFPAPVPVEIIVTFTHP